MILIIAKVEFSSAKLYYPAVASLYKKVIWENFYSAMYFVTFTNQELKLIGDTNNSEIIIQKQASYFEILKFEKAPGLYNVK